MFFFLLLSRKRYKETACAVCLVVAANVSAMLWLGRSLASAAAFLKQGADEIVRTYYLLYRLDEIPFDHSLFSIVKQVLRILRGWNAPQPLNIKGAYPIYVVGSALLLLWAGWFFWGKPVLNKLFAVVILMLVVPPVSYDYTLVHVYSVWGLFAIAISRDGVPPKVTHFLAAFAILMTPQSYLNWKSIAVAGQFKALVLVYLFYLACTVRLPSSLFGEPIPQRLRVAVS